MPAAHLAYHLNETPFSSSELDHYRIYPWSLKAAFPGTSRQKSLGNRQWNCRLEVFHNRPEFTEFVVES